MNKFLSIISIILLSSIFAFSQKYYFEGYVNSKDGNALIGATIFDIDSKKGTVTNEQGYFRLNLPEGKHTLKISYIGYKTLVHTLFLNKDLSKVILLQYSTMDEVIIKGSKQKTHLNPVQKPMEMDMITIGAIPSIIGEPDVMKALALLPGISLTSEVSSNLSVRGASHDQNLIMLDEAPLYQTGHLFGFISPFNYAAIKDVKVYKNAIPAIYGGKLSSVIDLHSNNGNNDSLKYEYNYGLLNAGFSLSTPIKKDKVSLFVAGRTFYLGILTLPLYYLYKKEDIDFYATYYLYDINANIKITPNAKDEYGLYFYSGVDKIVGLSHPDENLNKETNSYLSWGNHTMSLKYKRRLNNNIFVKNHLTFSKSFNETYFGYFDGKIQDDNFEMSRISSLNNISFKSYIEKYKGMHYIRYGLETNYNMIKPFEDKRTGTIESYITNKYSFFQADFFVDDMVDLGKISLYSGLRVSNYFIKDKHERHLEPRLSATYRINKSNSIGLGYQRLAQYSFLMPITNLGLPNDIWVSVLDNMSPSIIDQIFVEYNTDFYNEMISLETNIFYRNYSQLYDIKNKSSFLFNIPIDWQNYLSYNGKAYAYGFEMQTSVNLKNIRGIASYTYSRNKYKFSDLNQRDWFNGYYDFPHQFDINISGKISKRWRFSALFSYKSGKPVTLPMEVLEKSLLGPIVIYGDKNGDRLSPYHRLDISASKTWKGKKGQTKTLTLSIYNAYYHKNPFHYKYIRKEQIRNEETNSYEYVDIQPKIKEVSLIPIVPSVSYSIKF